MSFTIWTEYSGGGVNAQYDAELDELAAPGKCIGSGFGFGGIRDREYEFETEEAADAAANRVEENGYTVAGWVEEKK